MTHQTTLIYSQSLLNRAVLRFWWRTVSLRFLIPGVLIAAVLAIFVANGDRSWVVAVLASALVLGAIFPLAIFVAHYRNALQNWQAMGEPRARLMAGDRTFKLSSGAGVSTLPWTSDAAAGRRRPRGPGLHGRTGPGGRREGTLSGKPPGLPVRRTAYCSLPMIFTAAAAATASFFQ
jgi:hypothetical protein